MSRQNKVNPDRYTQGGRLTPDDLAREYRKQSDSGMGSGRARSRKAEPPWMANHTATDNTGAQFGAGADPGDEDREDDASAAEEAARQPQGKARRHAKGTSSISASAKPSGRKLQAGQKTARAASKGAAPASAARKGAAKAAGAAKRSTSPKRGATGGGVKKTAAKKSALKSRAVKKRGVRRTGKTSARTSAARQGARKRQKR